MIKRYEHDGDVMRDYDYGEWVSADDYDNLENELGDLQDKYDALVKKLGNLYGGGVIGTQRSLR
jgi:hypothetical protein